MIESPLVVKTQKSHQLYKSDLHIIGVALGGSRHEMTLNRCLSLSTHSNNLNLCRHLPVPHHALNRDTLPL